MNKIQRNIAIGVAAFIVLLLLLPFGRKELWISIQSQRLSIRTA